MLSTYKNYTITVNQLQGFLIKNSEMLGFNGQQLTKINKLIKKHYITTEMRNILYKVCLTKLEINKDKIESKYSFKHLILEYRYIIEMLYVSKFSNSFIAVLLNKNRSTICREINKNLIVYEDLNSIKSYKKGVQYIKHYSANEGQKNYDKMRANSIKPFKLEKDLVLAEAIK